MNIEEAIERILEATDRAVAALQQASEYFFRLLEEAAFELNRHKRTSLPRAERNTYKCNRMSDSGYTYRFRPVYLARGRC